MNPWRANAGGVITRRKALAATTAIAVTPAFAQGAARARVDIVVPGGVIQTLEGIDFGPDGTLYGTSIHGQAVYRIDVTTGAVGIEVPSPAGESDDVAAGPEGTPAEGVLAWTAQTTGEVRLRKPGGPVEVALPNAPRVNPIAFNRQGRLFAAQGGAGDNELWEIDVTGRAPPKVIKRGLRLNGFGFGPDGRLYAPHFGTPQLVAIDVDTGAHQVIATDVGSPAAAKTDGDGNVISVDYKTGDIWKTEMPSGASRIIVRVREPVDSLAIAKDGTVYLSNAADSAIYALNPATGAWRTVVPGWFTVPLDMTMTVLEGREVILVADPFGYRYIEPVTGEVFRPHWANNRGASSSVAATTDTIAFAYAGSGRLRMIDRASDALSFETTDIKGPRGMTFAANGDLIVADARDNRIVRLSNGTLTTVASGIDRPVGLIGGEANDVLVTEYASGTISRVDLATGTRAVIAGDFDRPTGIARMKDGRLVVVEPERGTVTAIGPDGAGRNVLARDLPLSIGRLHLPEDTPSGVAVAADGAIYIACGFDNSIRRITVS